MLKFDWTKIRPPKSFRDWLIVYIVVVILIAGGVGGFRVWYDRGLAPVSSNQTTIYFTVSLGDTRHQIAVNLARDNLIRSTNAFENYIRRHNVSNLQAGTYALNQAMGAREIIKKISSGEVAKNLLTILPGKRLDQIKQVFAKAGYSQAVINLAFNPATYAGHPLLASLPAGASLEGYLYPDSFQKDSGTSATAIIRESLDEMWKNLTSDVITGFSAQGLNVFQGITLASIVEQESSNPYDQPTVAQVFLLRLRRGMMLGSDVTAYYASALAGQPPSVAIDSPYNTRLYSGLPPGPIGSITADALRAVIHPAGTDYLYFVAGDDGVLHFSHTQQEHEAAIKQYCTKACGR